MLLEAEDNLFINGVRWKEKNEKRDRRRE